MHTPPRSLFRRFRSLCLCTVLSVGGSALLFACDSQYPMEVTATGGQGDPNTGGDVGATGGDGATGGAGQTGGAVSTTGGAATGGTKATGGTVATGGTTVTGGVMATGGSATGGATGGMKATGGMATGGMKATGGAATGGAATGGASGCGSTTYANFGMAFISKYCFSCHSNFGTQSSVKAAASQIKSRTVTGTSMPPASYNPKPTTAERTQLGAWIDCGTP